MQAWKKTSAYLRSHSWYADTLGLDYQSLRIPHFIRDIQERLHDPEGWISTPIEVVPAPKNQQWRFYHDKWEPCGNNSDKIRPLAHVHLLDQVVATALMLCLADRVETVWGDPRLSLKDEKNRSHILAYGHRLFCDRIGNELRHRWGSTKLYRQYFQDYQISLKRSKIVAEQLTDVDVDSEIAIVQSDLSNFYDRSDRKCSARNYEHLCGHRRKRLFSTCQHEFWNGNGRTRNGPKDTPGNTTYRVLVV